MHFSEYALKIASRCNLDCDYCYIYNKGDTGWRSQPKIMSFDIVRKIGKRIEQHAKTNKIPATDCIFHGGEPLLAGPEYLEKAAKILREEIHSTELTLGVQTNATLLTRETLDMFRDNKVVVGVSMDGGKEHQDRHRTYTHGGGSFETAHKGVSLLAAEYPDLFGGLLAVLDLANDPVAVYDSLAPYNPPAIDLLWPLGHYDDPQGHGYGDWLVRFFDHWAEQPAGNTPGIRFFKILIDRILGVDTRAGFIGPPPESISLIVQTDGSAELIDTFKSITDGAAFTGSSILTSTMDEIIKHPGFTQPELAQVCKDCELVDTCHGGHWSNRWSHVNGYDNPSIYCEDLKVIIGHLQEKIAAAR